MDSDDPLGVDALPKLDALFDYHQRLTAFASATHHLTAAAARYQAQYATTWWSSWMDHAASRGIDALVDGYAFIDTGLDKANRALLDLQNSEPYLQSQRELVGSIARFRSRHREIAEVWQNWNQAPTRRDVDEVAETLYQLRREVRALRRQIKAQHPPSHQSTTRDYPAPEVANGAH